MAGYAARMRPDRVRNGDFQHDGVRTSASSEMYDLYGSDRGPPADYLAATSARGP